VDTTDQKIIQLLTRDGRMSFADLGREVNLSTPAVHRRVKALEQTGVISGYTIRVNIDSLGGGLSALVAIESQGNLDHLVAELEHLPEVEACWTTAGVSDLIVKIHAATPTSLERLLMRIRERQGVDRTRTTVLLNTHFERGTDPAVLIAGRVADEGLRG
jgi:Lrp/AsnC family leucine-responsive transcriptional regulator